LENTIDDSVDGSGRNWQSSFEKLESFRLREGHCNVSQDQDSKLCCWVDNMKKRYVRTKKGVAKHPLTEEQMTALDTIEFEVAGQTDKDLSKNKKGHWRMNLKRMRLILKEKGVEGLSDVIRNDPEFGRWCKKQNDELVKAKNGENTMLKKPQLESLEKVLGDEEVQSINVYLQ
jgi:hypothetical protein